MVLLPWYQYSDQQYNLKIASHHMQAHNFIITNNIIDTVNKIIKSVKG